MVIEMANILITVFTGITAYLIYKGWQEQNESNIEVRLDNHPVFPGVIILCVENHGPGNARNLKFTTTPSTTEGLFTNPIERLGFIRYGISCLNSGCRRESMLTAIFGKFEEQKNFPVEIEVEYLNFTRNSILKSRKRKKNFILDFREFDLISPVPSNSKYLEEISETLKKIEKASSEIVGQSGMLRVAIQTPLDTNLKNGIWPYLGSNTIDKIPINIQRQNITEALNLIRNNPWYEVYTELSRLPPEIQREILKDLSSKFAEWKKHGRVLSHK